MDNPLVNNLHSGVTQNTAATNQRGATPLSGPSPSLSTQGATSAFKSTTPAPSFSSSTPSPALTNQQHQQQQQQQPHSNSGPSFPQFPYPSTNMWHTQHQGGPVTFATQPQFTMPPRTEEGHGLGLDPGNSADLAAMVGGYDFNFAAPMDIPTPPPPFGFATTQQQQQQQQQQYPGLQQYQPSMPFQRPALALDTSSQAFQMPQQQPPSSALSQPPSGLELSGTGLESLIQPSLYLSQAMDFNNATNQHPPPMYYPGTISPSALPHQMLKPAKSFSDLLLESRQSSVSASSTEHEWNGLEDLSVPLARTLVMDQANTHHHHSQQQQQQQQQQAQQQQAQQQAQHHAQQQQQLMHAAQQQQQQQLDIKPSMDRVLSDPSRNHLITQAIRWYMTAENRLAFGERKIIIMSPKVGQKSYGNEKRFLCPHPQATLIGKAWFTPSKDDCPVSPLLAPRVNISLSGEAVVKDGHVAWTTLDNKSLDDKIHTQAITTKDRPFLGNVAGKNLHISDMDSKRREVKALVTVKAPLNHHSGVHGWGPSKGTTHDISNERVIGVFESKEIKVISKPSKKKSNSKSAELIIQHGSTIALFNRVKSQTSSTRYLSVPIDLTRYPGSDGRPVTGAVPPAIPASDSVFRGFTVNPSVWESFIIYLVDPSKPAGPSNMKSSNSGWPNLPANIIPMALAPPVRYNSTIVLQSLQTGHISPVLVIRRGDDGSEVVGMDGTATDTNIACPEGELPGHPVSQLQKVAFEVYQPDSMRQFSRDSTYGGLWLSCDQETVREQFVSAERRWNPLPTTGRGNGRPSSMPNTPQSRFGVLPMTPHTTTVGLPSNPSSPISSSASSSTDYFGSHSRKSSSSALFSPLSSEVQLPTSTDGGPVRRQRTGSSSRGPLGRPAMHKKRASADITTSASYDYMPNAYVNVNAGAERLFWTLDVGDVCIWSIVSTEQVSYTFYVPPFVSEPTEPFAPFPVAHRLLPPNMSAEQVPSKYNHHYTSMSALPLVTFYGKNFAKRADGMARHDIYFGDKPATHNEVRCNEVMAAAEPVLNAGDGVQPVFLVRDDGQVIVPTGLKYPPTFP